MSKQYKIKRSRSTAHMIYKARPRLITIIFGVVAAAGLVYLGILIYRPIYDSVMNWGAMREEISDPMPLQQESEESSLPEIQPEPQKIITEKLRAVYLPPSLLVSEAARDEFLDRMPGDINAVMVDIKDQSGTVLFKSENKEATRINAVAADAFDLEELSGTLKARGISLIVRMSAFRDESAARRNHELAVNYRAPGTTWLDDFPDAGGKPWLNPYAAGAQDYLMELSREAVAAGAVMVVVIDFQFPPNSLTGDAYFGETGGVSRARCLLDFARRWEEDLAASDARLAVYMPVSGLAQPNLTLYGGEAADILAGTVLLGALPYEFSDQFVSALLGISKPLDNPANTVKQAVGAALELCGSDDILVLVQGGNEPESAVTYKQGQIAAQIDALKELEIEEYILYCTDPDLYLLDGE